MHKRNFMLIKEVAKLFTIQYSPLAPTHKAKHKKKKRRYDEKNIHKRDATET